MEGLYCTKYAIDKMIDKLMAMLLMAGLLDYLLQSWLVPPSGWRSRTSRKIHSPGREY